MAPGVRLGMTSTAVDVGAVYAVADRLGGAAEILDDAVNNHLTRLAFSGVAAGRAYAARGDALRATLDRLTAETSQWSRALVEIGAALRSGADRYADAEQYAAARIA